MATTKSSTLSWIARRRLSSDSLSHSEPIRRDSGQVIHEGWATKESGSAMFGKTNWRKRWFRLVRRRNVHFLEYYRGSRDLIPAGYVKLDVTYCTRPVESTEKRNPNCFAVGPIFDDGATRTYYISCAKPLEMREWMAVIDAVVQGAPEDAHRRRATVNSYFATKYKDKIQNARSKARDSVTLEESDDFCNSLDLSTSNDSFLPDVNESVSSSVMLIPESLKREEIDDDEMMDDIADEIEEDEEVSCSIEDSTSVPVGATAATGSPKHRHTPDSDMTIEQKRSAYTDTSWRLKQWEEFCQYVETANWIKSDTKDDITVSRCKFGRSSRGFAVIKVEGTLPSNPRNVFNFLQLSTKQGGKLDYLFRNEYIVQQVDSEPKATIIYNEFQPPLPQVSIRDVVAMKMWVPKAMSTTDKFGFIMFSVEHPDVPPPEKGYTRISVSSSGIILSQCPGPRNEPYTKLTITVQVAFYGAMHKMLKGAYNSGLLKLGLRTTFSHICDQLQRYLEITNI